MRPDPLQDLVFGSLLEASPDGVLVVDAEGRIVLANAQIEKMFGYERAELVGQPVEVLVPQRLRGRHRRHRDSYQRQPEARPMGVGLDLVGRCKDGTEVTVEISLSPVDLPAGTVTVAAVRDTTERMRLQREREAYRISLETEEERERIGMDLHDGIMQDIYAVALALEMAQADLPAEADETSQALDRAIDQLHDVVRDIRSYIFDLRPRRFSGDLARALRELGLEFEGNTSIATEVTADSDGSLTEEVSLALYHIAHEALSNVRKYAGASKVAIHLAGTAVGLRMEVADDGAGFDATNHRTESHRGLRNMVARATAVGGAIEINSAPGKGTRIRVDLPG